MRPIVLAALLAAGACASPTQRYHVASSMRGGGDIPPPCLPAAPPPPRIASAAAADAVFARTGVVYSRLPTPNRISADEPLALPRAPTDLRLLVGRRTKRDPFELAIGWANALGARVPFARTGEALLSWAREAGARRDLDEPPLPGDVLVFDEIESDADADLIAVVVTRDVRNVTEFVYTSGGVIRRGFVDANRPALRRDHEGVVVNTFMRTGRRWPPKGTHYLAGELLSNVIRTR